MDGGGAEFETLRTAARVRQAQVNGKGWNGSAGKNGGKEERRGRQGRGRREGRRGSRGTEVLRAPKQGGS